MSRYETSAPIPRPIKTNSAILQDSRDNLYGLKIHIKIFSDIFALSDGLKFAQVMSPAPHTLQEVTSPTLIMFP